MFRANVKPPGVRAQNTLKTHTLSISAMIVHIIWVMMPIIILRQHYETVWPSVPALNFGPLCNLSLTPLV